VRSSHLERLHVTREAALAFIDLVYNKHFAATRREVRAGCALGVFIETAPEAGRSRACEAGSANLRYVPHEVWLCENLDDAFVLFRWQRGGALSPQHKSANAHVGNRHK